MSPVLVLYMPCRLSAEQVKVHSFQGGLLGVLLNHSAVMRLDPLSTERAKEVGSNV